MKSTGRRQGDALARGRSGHGKSGFSGRTSGVRALARVTDAQEECGRRAATH